MTWAKLDDGFYDHPKVLEAGFEAIGLYCLALTYASHHATDGVLDAPVLDLLSRGRHDLVAKLVEVGLFDGAQKGAKIHDFLRYNPSARDLQKRRKGQRIRVRKHRACNALHTRYSSDPVTRYSGTGRDTLSAALGERSDAALDRAGQGFPENDALRTPPMAAPRASRVLPSSEVAATATRGAKSAPPTEFATWYAAYPRKRAPEDARRAWAATRLVRPPLADLLRVLGQQRASPEWVKDGGQFVPYPATYLRAHSWADELGPPTVGTRPPEDLSTIAVHPLAARLNALGKIEVHHG